MLSIIIIGMLLVEYTCGEENTLSRIQVRGHLFVFRVKI
jgi:hypothetical protein